MTAGRKENALPLQEQREGNDQNTHHQKEEPIMKNDSPTVPATADTDDRNDGVSKEPCTTMGCHDYGDTHDVQQGEPAVHTARRVRGLRWDIEVRQSEGDGWIVSPAIDDSWPMDRATGEDFMEELAFSFGLADELNAAAPSVTADVTDEVTWVGVGHSGDEETVALHVVDDADGRAMKFLTVEAARKLAIDLLLAAVRVEANDVGEAL